MQHDTRFHNPVEILGISMCTIATDFIADITKDNMPSMSNRKNVTKYLLALYSKTWLSKSRVGKKCKHT